MFDLETTLRNGYFVQDKNSNNLRHKTDIYCIVELLSKLEKNNVVLSENAVLTLLSLDKIYFEKNYSNMYKLFTPLKGQFFRASFATSSDIEEEKITYYDVVKQLFDYFIRYGLGEINYDSFKVDKNRMVDRYALIEENSEEIKELNKSFRIIDVKTTEELKNEVRNIIYMPIVFGEQQKQFLKTVYENSNIITELLEDDSNIKVKENIFSILDIISKDDVLKYNLLSTSTDVLRYAYFVSGHSFFDLFTPVKFSLKTSDKRVIMIALNKIAKKDMDSCMTNIKPYRINWVALSKNLFPGSSKYKKYMYAQEVFDIVRSNKKIETFNTNKHKLINNNDYIGLANYLKSRPGEFLRSLDMILRNLKKGETKELISIIESVEFNSKLIIQVYKWLEYREKNNLENRIFNVKGKPVQTEKNLKKLKIKRTDKTVKVLRDSLIKNIKNKELF